MNNSTHFRFEPSRFAPFALRCAVLAVRGLPPSTTASCVVTVGSQTSDFVPIHDDDHRGSEAARGTQYYQSEHPAFAHFGYDPNASSASILRVGLEWSGRNGRSGSGPSARLAQFACGGRAKTQTERAAGPPRMSLCTCLC